MNNLSLLPPTDEKVEARKHALPERRPLKGRETSWTRADFEDMAYLEEHLGRAEHQFAYTMADHPHYYTLAKKHWSSQDAFDEMAAVMKRQFREEERFQGSWYKRLRLNGYKHWFSSWPGYDRILVNRAPIEYVDTYLPHAHTYEAAWSSEEDAKEHETLFRGLGIKSGYSILDIGCGTGLLVDWNWKIMRPDLYTGVDLSLGMLGVFRLKHQYYADRLIRTSFEDFWTPQKFDKIVAINGVASHFLDPDFVVAKCSWLLKPGGEAILAYHRPDKPVRSVARLGADAEPPWGAIPPEQDNPRVTHESDDWYTHVHIRPFRFGNG